MSVCRRIVKPAPIGRYELHVQLVGPKSTALLGERALNGSKVETWTNSQLVQGRHFSIFANERHRLKIFATFADAAAKVVITLKQAGADLRTCELADGADTTVDMSLLAD